MPLVSVEQVKDQHFDYIVAGGGTAGLTLAARLSEDSRLSVLVLDAGNANLDDPLITHSVQYGKQFGNPKYDWAFKTTPQKHAEGRQYDWNRGKSLGGSSAMNFCNWTVPPKEDIDNWEKLGNKGWGWNDMEEYYTRAVTYTPLDTTIGSNAARDKETLKIWDMLDVDYAGYQAIRNLGFSSARSPYHGDIDGISCTLNTVDPRKHTRSYSASAFFASNYERPNFSVLTTAYVRRILTTGQAGEIEATGAEFSYGGENTVYKAHATQEVILSAGTLKSPQILELSGIGRPLVLEKLGIPVKVALEGVGENLQDHIYAGLSYELKEGTETIDVLHDEKIAALNVELLAKGEGLYTTGITNMLYTSLRNISSDVQSMYDSEKARIEDDIKENRYMPGLSEQYELMLSRLVSKQGMCTEITTYPGFLSFPNPPVPGKSYFTVIGISNHNFSRGTIHATSKDPLADPEIDPHYFEHDIDRQMLVAMIQFCRKVANVEPLKSFIANSPEESELNPGLEYQLDEALATGWIHKGTGTVYHAAGSLSMLPREKNGVVDTQLKVYGTKNIRVVDLSIVPLHFAAHPQSTVYAIAERAADIIKSGSVY